MKIIKYIFFVLLIVFATCLSFAQDDVYFTPEKEKTDKPNKRKIETGYVFIDGKYVELPYRVKRKGFGVYINNYLILNVNPDTHIQNTINVKESPGFPIWLTKMDSLGVYNEKIIKEYGVNYFSAQMTYLYTHYKFEDVPKLAKEYFLKFSNVKNVTGNTILTVEAYNGDTRNFVVGGSRFHRFSSTFGPDKVKTHKRNDAKEYLNTFCSIYNEMLERGDFFVYN